MTNSKFNKINLYIGILLVFTFVVFYPSVQCGFTNWDDNWMVTENPLIRSLSLSNLQELFFGQLYKMNYQPLVFLTFAIEYHFFELNSNVYHLTNLLLHLLNVLLVFQFIRLISDKKPVAWVVAILFAIHPMRVESVTWITTRRDVLYSLFYLLSLIQYMKYLNRAKTHKGEEKLKVSSYVLSLVFFLLSCTSKGMAVSLSLVLILIDYLFGRGFNKKVVLEKIPYFAISITFGLIAVFATHSQSQVELYDVYTFTERIQFASYGLLHYLYKLVLPVNLSAFYPYPGYLSGSLPAYYWLFPVVVCIIMGLVIYSKKNTKKILFGFGFFLVTIVMVLQLLPVYNGLVADRYTYISYIGLFYLLGEGCYSIKNTFKLPYKKYSTILAILGIAIILVFSLLTRKRISVWQNSHSLWTDVIEKFPDSPAGYINRGQYYSEVNKLNEALKDFSMAISIRSNAKVYANRGNIYARLKKYDNAIADYTMALSIRPNDSQTHYNRGLVYYYQGNYKASVNDYDAVIKLTPGKGAAYINRSLAYKGLNENELALQDALTAKSMGQKVNNNYLEMLKTTVGEN